ncbi:hypothetical protein JCM16303_001408 [Sporobolomyces ruberrimus]
MSSPNIGIDTSPLNLSDYLSDHSNDLHRALVSLINRHNRLLHDYAVLRQEKEVIQRESQRAAVENQQLWRSLKVTSPRPTTARQNSEGNNRERDTTTTTTTARGLGIGGALPEKTSQSSLRKVSGGSITGGGDSSGGGTRYDLPPPLPSSFHSSPRLDSIAIDPRLANAHAQSQGGLRAKAATPPPTGSPRLLNDSISSSSNLRKASSLDLGRSPNAPPLLDGVELGKPELGNGLPPRTPPSNGGSRSNSRESSPRLPTSASMPSMALNERGRFLPSITPVSPLMHEISENNASSSTDGHVRDTSSSEALQHQLQLPSSNHHHHHHQHSNQQDQTSSSSSASSRIRDRTFSNQSSGSNSLASAFEDRTSSYTPRSASLNPLPSTSSSYSLATLSGEQPRDRRQGGGGGGPPQPTEGNSSSRRPPQGSTDNDPYPTSSSSSGGGGVPPTRRQPVSSTTPLTSPSASNPNLSTNRPILNPSYLPYVRTRVNASSIRLNERNKETILFLIEVHLSLPPSSSSSSSTSSSTSTIGQETMTTATSWKVEKSYSEVLVLDASVKAKANRQERGGMGQLPDKSLFKDHAPHKSDQRKAVLEKYLQTLIAIPMRDRGALCQFLNTDIVSEPSYSSSSDGAMEGYLTKRGRNFGGWQTRYYVLTPGSCLSYYDSPNGSKLGEIPLQGAAIGRQSSSRAAADGTIGEDAYLHAFLIRTQNEKEKEEDHILCAENDDMRDRWVQALTTVQGRGGGSVSHVQVPVPGGVKSVNERERTMSNSPTNPLPPPTVIATSDSDPSSLSNRDRRRSGSGPVGSTILPEQDPRGLSARLNSDFPPSVSLPANLDAVARNGGSLDPKKGTSSSETGHSQASYASTPTSNKLQPPPSRRSNPSAPDRPLSPDGRRNEPVVQPGSTSKYSASDVSGPMNAVPLPSGYEFKKAERQKKTKSSFWNFAARGSNDKNSLAQPQAPSRPVFGVPLKEAVAISRIRPGLELPAVVYRCVEYLEAKNAEHEEGIFRLSGSANVIRLLKDRFNAEGDVNLVQSNEYFDPHAIAGLLKQYLRELPVHLLTRELQSDFLRVIDLRGRKDRVNALGKLVARLPIEEYTLFRFFFAHLCVIAQNADTSKMNLRNLGIVFSPTLAIPAPLFALFLLEFDLVFAVEKETGNAKPIMVDDELAVEGELDVGESRRTNRNSQLYQASNADKLMETDLTKLRESEETEEDAVADAVEDADAYEGGPEATTVFDLANLDPASTSMYYSSYAPNSHSALNGLSAQPRSPGLPASPRPGAIFETSPGQITPAR